ncbi:MAG TPA: AsnC family protein [Ktedonobacteraceae bacterium]|nr:AsnC family protein [Ktedonobacteraceae bacterium]
MEIMMQPWFWLVALFTLVAGGVGIWLIVTYRLLHILNRPYILFVVPGVIGAILLTEHLDAVITLVEGHPYALAIIPVTVLSIVLAWFLFKRLEDIVDWFKTNNQMLKQKLGSKVAFFWTATGIFMIVSVLESGQFFDGFTGGKFWGLLGYAAALAIDLIALQALLARLECVRMREAGGARLYLFCVAVCAGLSAYANTSTSLHSFDRASLTNNPDWMIQFTPWLGMAFPLLILIISITADYIVDQTNSKLDATTYRTQEQKRVDILVVRKEMQEKLLKLDQELSYIALQRKAAQQGRERRVFFLVDRFFPKQQADIPQITNELNGKVQTLQQRIEQVFTLQKNMVEQLQTAQKNEVKEQETDPDLPSVSPGQNASKNGEKPAKKEPQKEEQNSQNGQGQNGVLSLPKEDVLLVIKRYPKIARLLTTGESTALIFDVSEATGHSTTKLQNRVKKGVIKATPRNKNIVFLDSLIGWLKTEDTPQKNEQNTEAIPVVKTDVLQEQNQDFEAILEGENEPDKLSKTLEILKQNPDTSDEELAEYLGLSRPASARFWRLRAAEMLQNELVAAK